MSGHLLGGQEGEHPGRRSHLGKHGVTVLPVLILGVASCGPLLFFPNSLYILFRISSPWAGNVATYFTLLSATTNHLPLIIRLILKK